MAAPRHPPSSTVALFVTCMVDTLYPSVGIAAADLLERHGARVVFPEGQTCCGQPAFNDGHRGPARDQARRFLRVFWPLLDSGDVDAIVAPSGSCVAMVRRFPLLLGMQDESPETRRRAQMVSRHTYELSQYLVDVLGVAESGASCAKRVAYHPCCHLLRELGIDAQPRRLLARLEGVDLVELPAAEECCGFGGLFALHNEAISTAMGRRKIRNIEASEAELVAVCDVSCMTHLNGLLERGNHATRVVHVADLLGGAGDPAVDSSEEIP